MLLFLGAGASKPFGIPTIPEFVEIFEREFRDEELYKSLNDIFGHDLDLEVAMTVPSDLNKPRNEIFETLSPQTADFLFRKSREEAMKFIHDEEIKRKIAQLLERMKEIVRQRCIAALKSKSFMEPYDDFFRFFENIRPKIHSKHIANPIFSGDGVIPIQSKVSIVTTNYDTCLEEYLRRRQIEFVDGIERIFGRNLFVVDSYNKRQGNIKVLKLHGSIDLYRSGDHIQQVDYRLGDLKILTEEYGEVFIHWPIEFGGYKYVIESPNLEMFSLFRKILSEDDIWIIIGFSFRDRSICSLMNNLLVPLKETDRPQIALISPNPDPIRARLRQWGMNLLTDLMHPTMGRFGDDSYHKGLEDALTSKSN